MAKVRESSAKPIEKHYRKPLSDEARVNQLINLAYDLVEQRLRDGTASASEVVKILGMGSEREQLELDKLRSDKKLSDAKVEAIETAKRYEEDLKNAMEAWKGYAGKH